MYDRLTLGVREGAEAEGDADPAAPPDVALSLADRLPVLEAADEGEAREADKEGLLVEDKVCCDLVEHWLLKGEPVNEAQPEEEGEDLAETLGLGDKEPQELTLGDMLALVLVLGQGEAVAEAFPLLLALKRRVAEGVLVRSIDPGAVALTEGDLLAERV